MKQYKRRLCLFCTVILLALTLVAPAGRAAAPPNAPRAFANVVVFVQFDPLAQGSCVQGKEARITQIWDDRSRAKSLASYLDAISYGQFQVKNIFPQLKDGVITPYVVSTGARYSEYSLVSEVIRQIRLDAGTMLDYDGDGAVDNLVIIAQSGYIADRNDTLHAHKANFDDATQLIGGKRVYTYNIINSYAVFDDTLSGEGVVCHEFLHSVGFPDLYRSEGSDTPVGMWDLMASSSIYLQYPLAYLRSAVGGWLDGDTVTADSHLTLDAASSSSGKRFYILKTPLSDTEFFVVEYRKQAAPYKGLLEEKIPGSGLIVYRVNTRVAGYSNFGTSTDGIYVFRQGAASERACGDRTSLARSFLSSEAGRTRFGSDNLEAGLADNALVYSDGTNSGIVIENVGSASGDQISFDVSFTDLAQLDYWKTLGGRVLSEAGGYFTWVDRDDAGRVYALYNGADGRFYAACYENGAWRVLAGALPAGSTAEHMCVYKNKPYVLYNDAGSYHLKLGVFEAEGFRTIDTLSATMDHPGAMATGENGLYIAYTEGEMEAGELRLQRYDGSALQMLADRVDTGYLVSPSLAVLGQDVYIGYRDFGRGEQAVVKTYSGGGVRDLPATGVRVGGCKVRVDGAGQVYLLAMNQAGLSVYQAGAGGWQALGAPLTQGNVVAADMQFAGNVPCVALSDQSAGRTYMMAYRNGAWTRQGANIDALPAANLSLVLDDRNAYVGYTVNEAAQVKCKPLDAGKDPIETPQENPVQRIRVTPPAKVRYTAGAPLDLTGLRVEAVRADQSATMVALNACTISGYDAQRTGVQQITVAYGGFSASFSVTVEAAAPPSKPLAGIALDTAHLSLNRGAQSRLRVTYTPSDTTDDKTVRWRSSNTAVARVDGAGVVTAQGNGSATITATVGQKTATCQVQVRTPLAGISLSAADLALQQGQSARLSVVYTPSDTTDARTVSWSSSNAGVASVDSNGNVRALSSGSAVIQARVGSRTASCSVRVSYGNNVRGFVDRLYQRVLGRAPDPVGFNGWVQDLTTRKITGSQAAEGFVCSRELQARNLSDETYVSVLYRTFLNRDPDPVGRASWMRMLQQGVSREYVLKGFVDSQEFNSICVQYGIEKGTIVLTQARDQNDQVTMFVYRLYAKCLQRTPDMQGLNHWSDILLRHAATPKEVAWGFIFSDEFQAKHHGNDAYIEILYETFLDRSSDPIGRASWRKALAQGASRQSVFHGFADSVEFKELVRRYHLG